MDLSRNRCTRGSLLIFRILVLGTALSSAAIRAEAQFAARGGLDACVSISIPEIKKIDATFEEPVQVGQFKYGIGSKMTLVVDGKPLSGVFVGRLTRTDATSTEFTFFDLETERALTLPQSKATFAMNGKPVDWMELQTILDPLPQVGENCAGYGIDYWLISLWLGGFTGNGELAKTLSTEQGRSQLLALTNSDYYLEPKNQYDVFRVLKLYRERFGYDVVKIEGATEEEVVQGIYAKLDQNVPVVLDFWIGSNMVTSPVKIYDALDKLREDPRLWIPVKIGERNGGGHVVNVVGRFKNKAGKEILVVVDSDWSNVRFWDAEKYLVFRVRTKNVNAYTRK